MEQTQHTPGPRSEDGWNIARVWRSGPNRDADAALIASAPDLAAELATVKAQLETASIRAAFAERANDNFKAQLEEAVKLLKVTTAILDDPKTWEAS